MRLRKLQHIILFILFLGSIMFALSENGYYSILDKPTRYASESSIAIKPKSLSFCGEIIPMTEPDVAERFKKELDIYVKYKASTRLLIKRANKWFPKFEEALNRHNVPEDLKYLVAVESAFTNARSNKGALGFWQIRTITGRFLGLTINEEIDERLHPVRATKAAARYFRMAHNIFDSWTMAAASYNMGISGLKKRIKAQKPDTYYDLKLNSETARYLFKALAFKEVYQNPEKYKIYPRLSNNDKLPQKSLTTSIENLSIYAASISSHADSIRKYNPWILGNTIPVKKGQVLTIYTPLYPNVENTKTSIVRDNEKEQTDDYLITDE